MTTLAELTRQIASHITDVVNSTASAGSDTTITDATALTQPNGYWDGGIVWLNSGTHAGKYATVSDYKENVLTFPTFTTSVGTPRYTVARSTFPIHVMIQAINSALDEVRIAKEDASLTGDGDTLEFTLPAGVQDVYAVEFKNPSDTQIKITSTHWRERNGKLRFDIGYAPIDDWVIHVWYRGRHAELTTYSDEIDNEIDYEWLKQNAIVNVLRWGLRQYGSDEKYRVEDMLNEALRKANRPRRDPFIKIRTAGGFE